MPENPLPSTFLIALRAFLQPAQLYTAPEDCWVYGYDNSRRHALPQAVLFPDSHEQIVAAVRQCNNYHIPLTVRGRGTATTGASVPVNGGLVMSLERMRKIVEFAPDNRYIRVEPGISNQELQDQAAASRFFWPPDPTSAPYCSIGGNLACNAAGPRAVKYGTPRENTLGLRAVTGSGEELRTGVCTTKSAVGYDLTRLLIGSEGTLAIITEATLKLTPLPEAKKTLRALYCSVDHAAAAIAAIMAQPVVPCALEFIDAACLQIVQNFANISLPPATEALLLIEVDGLAASLDQAAGLVAQAARNTGAIEVAIADSVAEVTALWRIRKTLAPALRKAAPQRINEDIAVPVSQIPALIQGLQLLSAKHGIKIINFGHAGNGNIHVNLLLDPSDPQQSRAAQHCLAAVFALVLNLGGTLSGEHGIGLEKREFIDHELDAINIILMRKIKQLFDPNGILNPGKILPYV